MCLTTKMTCGSGEQCFSGIGKAGKAAKNLAGPHSPKRRVFSMRTSPRQLHSQNTQQQQ